MQHSTRAISTRTAIMVMASRALGLNRYDKRELAARSFVVLAALVALLLPIRAGLAQPTPNKPTGTWRSHACVDCVRSMEVTDYVWVGTFGAGVARHDTFTGQTLRFTTDEGVGGNCVEVLSASDDGHVWVATRETSSVSPHSGVSHYDGSSWSAFTTADGLPSDTVADVAAGPGGIALVAADDQIARYDGATWQSYSAANGLPTGRAVSVAVGSDGTMWAAMQDGVAKFDAGTWIPVDMSDLPAAEVNDMVAADDGTLWVTSGGALGHHQTGGWGGGVTWRVATPPVDSAVRVRLDPDGDAWTWGGPLSANRVHEFNGASWVTVIDFTALKNDSGTNTPATNDFDISPADELWIGTYNDGLAYKRGSWQWFVTEFGPSNPVVMSVSVDYWDSPWIGLTSQHHTDNLLNRYDGWYWERYDSTDGMLRTDGSGLGIMPGAIDARGGGMFSVWLGVTGVGVAKRDFGSWTTWPITDVVGSSANILGVAADGSGGAWVATNGAAHYDGSAWHRYTSADGLASNSTLSVAVDKRGADSVWIGTADAGVSHFDGTTWQTYTAADGLGSDKVQAILVDDIGDAVWFGAGPGTRGGVTRYDGVTWQNFGTAEGLAGDGVWALALAPDGAVWAAVSEGPMSGAGLARYDGTSWALYTHADGLIDNSAYDVDVDSDGKVWVATLAGVSEFTPDDDPYPYPYPGVTDTPTPTETTAAVPSSVPPTATPTATMPGDTPVPTYSPPSGEATPVPGSCVCTYIRGRVPDAAINHAIANPNTVAGWGVLLDPNKPWAPYNPYRSCLSIERISVPYNPLHNRLVWRVGCP